jgi:hypothetical protein
VAREEDDMIRRIIKSIECLGFVRLGPCLETRMVNAEDRAMDIGDHRRGKAFTHGGAKYGDAISGMIQVIARRG